MPTPARRHPPSAPLPRRAFLLGGAALAATSLLPARTRAATGGAARLIGDPFTLGIASGEPAPDGVVLWTRLAPRPLEPGGGLPPAPIEVTWRVAEDETFTRLAARGTATADSAWAHSVHVEVSGLRPDRWYWYQFQTGDALSPVGRTRTLPAPGAAPDRLRFAFASCQKYETGYYTAYEHLAREDLDLVLHLGDYIYEKDDGKAAVRPHGTPEIFTLDDYRARYARYKTDAALQAAHAFAPWIVTWDDHEVSNDYAGAVPEEDPAALSSADFLVRRAAAYQAYYEHQSLRAAARPIGPHLRLYRHFDFGTLARLPVLDTRQYRTNQPAGPHLQPAGPHLHHLRRRRRRPPLLSRRLARRKSLRQIPQQRARLRPLRGHAGGLPRRLSHRPLRQPARRPAPGPRLVRGRGRSLLPAPPLIRRRGVTILSARRLRLALHPVPTQP